MAENGLLNCLQEADVRPESETSCWCSLPIELKLRILQYVDIQTIIQSVALVNKEFNELSKDPSLYGRCHMTYSCRLGLKKQILMSLKQYKSYRKVFSTEKILGCIDFTQFTSLKQIILYDTCEEFFIRHHYLPKNLKKIQIYARHIGGMYFTPSLLSLPITVDVLHTSKEEDLKVMFNIPADQYLINAGIFMSSELWKKFQVGEFRPLLQMDNVGFLIDHIKDDFVLTNILHHFPLKVVRVSLSLDCSLDVHRQFLIDMCQKCSFLEHLEVFLYHSEFLPKIEAVVSKSLQELIVYGSTNVQGPMFLQRFEPLLRATRRELFISGFVDLPLGVLCSLNSSLSSITLQCCTWGSEREDFHEQKLLRNLKMLSTSGAPMLLRIYPNITKLDINCYFDKFVDICTALGSLSVLQEFSLSRYTWYVYPIVEALLASKDSLRVCCIEAGLSDRDARETLQLLRRFKHLQYFEIDDAVEYTNEQVREFFPTAIFNCYSRYETYEKIVFL